MRRHHLDPHWKKTEFNEYSRQRFREIFSLVVRWCTWVTSQEHRVDQTDSNSGRIEIFFEPHEERFLAFPTQLTYKSCWDSMESRRRLKKNRRVKFHSLFKMDPNGKEDFFNLFWWKNCYNLLEFIRFGGCSSMNSGLAHPVATTLFHANPIMFFQRSNEIELLDHWMNAYACIGGVLMSPDWLLLAVNSQTDDYILSHPSLRSLVMRIIKRLLQRSPRSTCQTLSWEMNLISKVFLSPNCDNDNSIKSLSGFLIQFKIPIKRFLSFPSASCFPHLFET